MLWELSWPQSLASQSHQGTGGKNLPRHYALPFLQDVNKLGEPVTLHLGGLPQGFDLGHLCLPAFLFWRVREPETTEEGRGQGLSEA